MAGGNMVQLDITVKIDGEIEQTVFLKADQLPEFFSMLKSGFTKKAPVEKLQFDPDELRRLYVDENLTARECAKRLGISKTLFYNWVSECGIHKSVRGKTSETEHAPINADELKRLYIDENLTAEECAKRMGLTSSSVKNYIHNHGLQKQINIPTMGARPPETPPEMPSPVSLIPSSSQMPQSPDDDYDSQYGLFVSKVREIYIVKDCPISETARILHVPPEKMRNFINKHGLRKNK